MKKVMRVVHWTAVMLAATFVASYVVSFLLAAQRPTAGADVSPAAWACVGLAVVAFVYVLIPGGPLWRDVLVGITATIQVLFGFAFVYWEQAGTAGSCMNVGLTKIDSVYFTLSTFATVGFGDIVPVTQACRAIVAGQITSDFVLAALLVTWLLARLSPKALP